MNGRKMMKSLGKTILFLLLLMLGVFCVPGICMAKEAARRIPVYGEDIRDGSYEVEVDSSSSMFRVVKADLQVADGNMTAVLTLSGVGYLKLFMGTGEKALEVGEESFIPYVEDAKGQYTYTIPVEALDKEFDCAAFSKKKQKWYDRTLVVLSSSLPEDAMERPAGSGEDGDGSGKDEDGSGEDGDAIGEEQDAQEMNSAKIQVGDGDYTIELTLNGGTGKAAVISPARVHVEEGKATAVLEWSSPFYDYMYVNGTRYIPVNTEGNSVFEIPIPALDEEISVTADTTAMSKPHEIEYKLIFHADTWKKEMNFSTEGFLLMVAIAIAAAVIGGAVLKRKAKNA